MSEYQIAVVVGSLRRHSLNRKLASAMARLAPSDFSFRQVEIGDLPLYNQDHDAQPTESVQRLKAEIAAAQGLLFVTPEFDHAGPLRCLGKTACRLIATQLARGVRGFSMCRRCAEYGMMHGAEGRHHCPTPKHPTCLQTAAPANTAAQPFHRCPAARSSSWPLSPPLPPVCSSGGPPARRPCLRSACASLPWCERCSSRLGWPRSPASMWAAR